MLTIKLKTIYFVEFMKEKIVLRDFKNTESDLFYSKSIYCA